MSSYNHYHHHQISHQQQQENQQKCSENGGNSSENVLRQLIFVSIENKMEEEKSGVPAVNYAKKEPGMTKDQHIIRVRDSVEAMLHSIEERLTG